jgi:hypothetical protein
MNDAEMREPHRHRFRAKFWLGSSHRIGCQAVALDRARSFRAAPSRWPGDRPDTRPREGVRFVTPSHRRPEDRCVQAGIKAWSDYDRTSRHAGHRSSMARQMSEHHRDRLGDGTALPNAGRWQCCPASAPGATSAPAGLRPPTSSPTRPRSLSGPPASTGPASRCGPPSSPTTAATACNPSPRWSRSGCQDDVLRRDRGRGAAAAVRGALRPAATPMLTLPTAVSTAR